MKQLGARRHPMSGAGRIKGDGSDDNYVYEVKDAAKAYTLSGAYLHKLMMEAMAELKEPCMIIYFAEHDITATITTIRGKQA